MKEAKYYKKIEDKKVRCELCPRECIISDGKYGFCSARKNIEGKLYSMVYEKPIALNDDPIEKKPLFHFLPGTRAFSIGTVGCNLACLHCQNWEMSRATPEQYPVESVSPEKIVELAVASGCKSVSFTYNEPTVFYEYALDTAKLAKKAGFKTTFVSNGYINKEPLIELSKYLDGDNVDLKGFNPDFYKKVCSAELEPVLETLLTLKEKGVWLEITNLVIPGFNDNFKEIEDMCVWISKNLGKNVPLHFSRFFPMYKMTNVPDTPLQTLQKAYSIAKKHLDYVYVGNIVTEMENTYCPNCKKLLIERGGFFGVYQNNVIDGKCKFCNYEIAGVWK